MRLRPVTAADFHRYAGRDIPPEWCIAKPVGYVAEREGDIVALGVVTWDQYGRAWGWLEQRERVSMFALHREALAMLKVLRGVGEPRLYAFCSQTIPNSEKWLRRLGFLPMPELTTDPQHPVWSVELTCELST